MFRFMKVQIAVTVVLLVAVYFLLVTTTNPRKPSPQPTENAVPTALSTSSSNVAPTAATSESTTTLTTPATPTPYDAAHFPRFPSQSFPKSSLVVSTYVTNAQHRSLNRYSRINVFLFTLMTYARIPFESVYLYIFVEDPSWEAIVQSAVEKYFLPGVVKELKFWRLSCQRDWKLHFLDHFVNESDDYPIFHSSYDDHPLIEDSFDVLSEGMWLVANDSRHRYRVAFPSHWPEGLRLTRRWDTQAFRIGRAWVAAEVGLCEGTMFANLGYWKHVFLDGYSTPGPCAPRVDGFVPEHLKENSNYMLLVPLRELVRKFNGYASHPGIPLRLVPALVFPPEDNVWPTDNTSLKKRMLAPGVALHYRSSYAKCAGDTLCTIPDDWVETELELYRGYNGKPFEALRNWAFPLLPLPTTPPQPTPTPHDAAHFPRFPAQSFPKTSLVVSTYVTNARHPSLTRFHRLNVFLFALMTYARIPFENAYLYVFVEDPSWEAIVQSAVNKYFLPGVVKELKFWRLSCQREWKQHFLDHFVNESDDYPIFFSSNDDHPLIEDSFDVLSEGMWLVANESRHRYRMAFPSHWPEALLLTRRWSTLGYRIGRAWVAGEVGLIEGTSVANLGYWKHVFLDGYPPGHCSPRIDLHLPEHYSENHSFLLLVPLRELARKFNGYASHPGIPFSVVPPLLYPPENNVWPTDNNSLKLRMVPGVPLNHRSFYARCGVNDTLCTLPDDWVEAELELYKGYDGKPFEVLRNWALPLLSLLPPTTTPPSSRTPPPSYDAAHFPRFSSQSFPKSSLVVSTYVTNARNPALNRVHRLNVFLFALMTYARIPFESVYLYISVEEKSWEGIVQSAVNKYFLPGVVKELKFRRLACQHEWEQQFLGHFVNESDDYPIFCSTNDDHPFIEDSLDVLSEGMWLVANDSRHRYRVAFPSHWPEGVLLTRRWDTQAFRIGRAWVAAEVGLCEGTTFANLGLWKHAFLDGYPPGHCAVRVDGYVPEHLKEDSNYMLLVPLRELVRKFNGYASHPGIPFSMVPALVYPPENNVWPTDNNSLKMRMVVPGLQHRSVFARFANGTPSTIPDDWVEAELELYRGYDGKPFEALRNWAFPLLSLQPPVTTPPLIPTTTKPPPTPPYDAAHFPRFPAKSFPKSSLVVSTYVTNARNPALNRFSRINVFLFALMTYARIPFESVYLYIMLENKTWEGIVQSAVNKYFLPGVVKELKFFRLNCQQEWKQYFLGHFVNESDNYPIFCSSNDDHPLIEDSFDVLSEGMWLVANDSRHRYRVAFPSHWPEGLRLTRRWDTQAFRIGRGWVAAEVGLCEGTTFANLGLWKHAFLEGYPPGHCAVRVDGYVPEHLREDSNYMLLVPLRELVRKFNGYESHPGISFDMVPALVYPPEDNVWPTDNTSLKKRMLAPGYPLHHRSVFARFANGTPCTIPDDWVEAELELYKGYNGKPFEALRNWAVPLQPLPRPK